ncbi:MAG: tetratricopeptide repeat protein [Nitrospirae bacterium]|nr:tetratricopeptide repeat protein [Nitrospirota bacterium]
MTDKQGEKAASPGAAGSRLAIICGSGLLMASPFIGWINRPLLGWLKGNAIRFSEHLPSSVSYGMICLVLGGISLAALNRRWRWIGFIAGIIGIMISLHFYFDYALINSKKLLAIQELNRQEYNIIGFTEKNLPPNLGVEPFFDESGSADTVAGRLSAMLHFATLGWYAAIIGSTVLVGFFAGSAAASSRRRNMLLILFVSSFLLYSIIFLAPVLSAEYHRNKGSYYLAAALYGNAVDEYEQARRLDRNITSIRSFHISIGTAYFFMKRTDMADWHIYQASLFFQEDIYPMAVFHLNNALRIDPSLAERVGSSYLAAAHINEGLLEYRKGNTAAAIEAWNKALERDPSQIQAYYYLSRAYYDVASYDKSIMTGLTFFTSIQNKQYRANVSANIADAYYKMKTFSKAREFYLKSQMLDKDENLRAVLSLVGK